MPRPLDPEARRGEILDDAFVVFARRGYHALSMRDLARELGVTTGALYHWFESKPALFAAMLDRQVARQVESALAEIARRPANRRLAALAAHMTREADDFQRTLVVALDYHRAHPDEANRLADALGVYRDALGAGLGLSPERARLVLSVLLGELLQRILDPNRDLALETLLPLVTPS